MDSKKKLILILFLYNILFPANLFAGNNFLFSNDSSGLEFNQIKYIENLNQLQLFSETSNFLSTTEVIDAISYGDSLNWILYNISKVLQANLGKGVGHPIGKIDYNVLIEFKDGKFRLTYKNIFFTPMKRDRYGIFKPFPSKRKIVSTDNFNPKKTNWKKIYAKTNDLFFDQLLALENYLLSIDKREKAQKSKSEW